MNIDKEHRIRMESPNSFIKNFLGNLLFLLDTEPVPFSSHFFFFAVFNNYFWLKLAYYQVIVTLILHKNSTFVWIWIWAD